MATQTKEKHVRVPKGKNPRQLAQKQANIEAYDKRNKRLAQQHRDKNAERKLNAVEYQQKLQQEAYEVTYVQVAVYGPAKHVLLRWLADRPATFSRVKRFFDGRPLLPQPQKSLVPQPDKAA